MHVILLLLENAEEAMYKEAKSKMPKVDEEDLRQREIDRINGKTPYDEPPVPKITEPIFINVVNHYKETHLFIDKSEVIGIFLSTVIYRGNPKMVLILRSGRELDCLFDPAIYESMSNELINK